MQADAADGKPHLNSKVGSRMQVAYAHFSLIN